MSSPVDFYSSIIIHSARSVLLYSHAHAIVPLLYLVCVDCCYNHSSLWDSFPAASSTFPTIFLAGTNTLRLQFFVSYFSIVLGIHAWASLRYHLYRFTLKHRPQCFEIHLSLFLYPVLTSILLRACDVTKEMIYEK